MKIIISALILMLYTPLYAQEIGEQVIFSSGNVLNNLERNRDLYFNRFRKNFTKIRSRKINEYNKKGINFEKRKEYKIYKTFNGDSIYYIGKLKRRNLSRTVFTFEILSDIKYVKNEQLFAKNNIDRDGNLAIEEPVYFSNGNVYSYTMVEEDLNTTREVLYASNGNLIKLYTKKSEEFIPLKNHKKYKNASEAFWTYHKMKPNLLTSDGQVYMGFPHIGSLHTKNGYILTGFHYPLKPTKGNGSVLFSENEKTGECAWIVVIDGKVREKRTADCSEKPDLEMLFENTDAEVLRLKNTFKTWPQIKIENKSDPEYYFSDMILASINSKDIATKDGYGIKLNYSDLYSYGDRVTLEVGMFKNGKLTGIGYKANLRYNIMPDPKKSLQRVNVTAIEWDAKYGYFENGIQKAGNTIWTDQPYTLSSNVYDEVPYPNFLYLNTTPKWEVTDKTIRFQDLKKKYYVYSTKLHRLLFVEHIDYENQRIKVRTDIEGKSHYFGKENMDGIYGFEPKFEEYRVNCPVTISVPNYVNKEIELFRVSSGTETNRRVVKGVYFDKIITTTRSKGPGRAVTTNKVVKEGYKTTTCPKCNGVGYLTKTKQKGAFCRITF